MSDSDLKRENSKVPNGTQIKMSIGNQIHKPEALKKMSEARDADLET